VTFLLYTPISKQVKNYLEVNNIMDEQNKKIKKMAQDFRTTPVRLVGKIINLKLILKEAKKVRKDHETDGVAESAKRVKKYLGEK
jgi:hypothetical protein